MAINANEMMTKMVNRVEFSEQDKQTLSSHADWASTIASSMADAFYSYLGNDPEMSSIINASEGRVHRLRATFVQWFHEMFTGIDQWGTNYADRRWQIGLAHVRVGIYPEHVIPAMAAVVRAVGQQLKVDGKPEDLKESLSKICMIDLAFIEQAYIEVSAAAVLRETGWTEGLFRRLVLSGAKAS
jgi:hypothetical protein